VTDGEITSGLAKDVSVIKQYASGMHWNPN
jgi:hypothetical protein